MTKSAVISTTNVAVQITGKQMSMSLNNTTMFVYDKSRELLIKAFNNRTRERNYFKLYCEMLEGEITEDEFDNEIDSNPDDYVVPAGNNDSLVDVETAMSLVKELKGLESADDFMSIFQFDDKDVHKCIEAK